MFIDVSQIRKSPGQSYHFDLTEAIVPLAVGNDEIHFRAPVKVSMDIKNTGKVLDFSGNLQADTELICSRCLEGYAFHLDTDFKEQFCHESDLEAVTGEGLDTADMHIFDTNRIKLDDLLNEIILLGIPMRCVCNDNCKGLCAVCGANLNDKNCNCIKEDIDPRLGVLKKYFD
ncbi:MAG: YceD family protein [Eubacteriales bacterium]